MTRIHRRRTALQTFLLATLAAMAAQGAAAGDLWVAATDPAVVTNNDCGQIAAIRGNVRIHRFFHLEESDGIPANVADRLSSGDELIADADSRVEWITGANTIAVLGSGGRVRFDGLRTFDGAEGRKFTRLDLTLMAGELRAQVRLNENRPEAVFTALGGADFLLFRGDLALFAGTGWRGASLRGSAGARIRRGNSTGAAFVVPEGTAVDGAGESRLPEGGAEELRLRLPFSFEVARAALPPMPAMSAEDDAP